MRIAVVGTGAIGGYIGAELAVGGAEVVLLGRRGREPHRIRAVRVDGTEIVPPRVITTVSSPEHLRVVDAVIVTVKSRHTLEVARELAEKLHPRTPVLTLQNGLDNATLLASRLGPRVSSGIVTYNVFIDGEGRRCQATRGRVLLQRPGRDGETMLKLAWCLERGGERISLRRDIGAAVAGKLLLNLQNGVAASLGLGLRDFLADADARWCFAECVREGLAIMRLAGMHPGRVLALPPAFLPAALRLPNAIIGFVVPKIVATREGARSSMLQDLERGVPTEIDEINGAIVNLARTHGVDAPMNAIVRDAVRDIEEWSDAALRVPFLSSRELRRRMERRERGTELAATLA